MQKGADSNLIEHILNLLSIPEYSHMEIEQIMENTAREEASTPEGAHYIRIVQEVLQFMDEMPGGFLIYHADEGEQIIYANKALLRIFQCKTLAEFREWTGNSFKGFVYPEDLELVERSIREQIADSQYDLDYVEYRILRKDGEIRWLEDYGHFVQSKTVGDIFYVFVGDATEKKKRQQDEKAALVREKEQEKRKIKSLMEEYDKERTLINQEYLRRLEVIESLSVSYESILYADLNTNRILPYRLSGRTERQFESRYQVMEFSWFMADYIATWVHPEDRSRVEKAMSVDYIKEKLTYNKTYYVNFRALKGGELQYLQLRIVNVGEKKQISQVVMGFRRVDEEVLRGMEQKQLLEEALKNANLAITAKNTFLSNMSHDMRTPLNAIFGYTILARKYIAEKDAVLGYLGKIEASSGQLLDLIEKVLEISWTEAQNVHVVEGECNLCDIIQDTQKTLHTQAEEKGIDLSVEATDLQHCDVYADEEKLRQILLYLGNNAVSYTENGGRVVVSVTEVQKLPNHYAVYQFVVEDTGIGISKEFLEHIFEPFEREKNTTFSGIHGTGLGLTIVKNLVDVLGGHIKVSSTVGKGSTFTVTLRFRIQNQPVVFSADTESALSQLLKQKILLVEDNEINLEIETEILQGLGFFIETATDGSVAVEKVEKSKPGEFGLVLMDVQMPVMDGRQAAEAIRRLGDPGLSHIPIIALSANAYESDKKRSIESGMDAHLTKPIDIPVLLDTIAKTIQGREAMQKEEMEQDTKGPGGGV